VTFGPLYSNHSWTTLHGSASPPRPGAWGWLFSLSLLTCPHPHPGSLSLLSQFFVLTGSSHFWPFYNSHSLILLFGLHFAHTHTHTHTHTYTLTYTQPSLGSTIPSPWVSLHSWDEGS
jgi:hypothetical protein